MGRLEFRLSEIEKEQIKQLAEKAELSVSDYIRKSALNAKISPRLNEDEVAMMRECAAARTELKNFKKLFDLKTKDLSKEERLSWLLLNNHFEVWARSIGIWIGRMDNFWDEHIKR